MYNVAVNLTRLIPAKDGSGGIGWYGVKVAETLATKHRVTVLARPWNETYVRAHLAEHSGLRIELVPGDLGAYVNGHAGNWDVYLDPLNGLEPSSIPATLAVSATIADLMFDRLPSVFDEQELRFRAGHYGDAIERSDVVTTISSQEKQNIEKHYPSRKVEIVRIPAVFTRNRRHRETERSFRFFAPGVQWNHKNHFRVVAAFAALHNAGRIPASAQLFLSAIEPHEAAHRLTRALIRATGLEANISFAPYMSEAEFAEFLNTCDGVIVMSMYEGYGIPIVEAVAAGMPVLTSRAPALEFISPFPDFLKVVENPFDGAELVSKLEDFIVNLPHAEPSRDACPSNDAFLQDLESVIRGALEQRALRTDRRRDESIPVPKRRYEDLSIFMIATPETADQAASAEAFGNVTVFQSSGVPTHIPADPKRRRFFATAEALPFILTHEILLSRDRFVLLCPGEAVERIDGAAVKVAIERFLAAKLPRRGPAKVSLEDLLEPRGVTNSAHGFSFGLYDLEKLGLDFESSVREVRESLASASLLFDAGRPRAFIIDPSLKNSFGHHLGVARDLAVGYEDFGYRAIVLANNAAALKRVEGAAAVMPEFPDYLYGEGSDIGLFQWYLKSSMDAAGLESRDEVTLFCATPAMLAAAMIWMTCQPQENRPTVSVRFDRPHWRSPPSPVRYETVFLEIKRLGLRKHFRFFVESVGLQRYFEKVSGEKFDLLFITVGVEDTLRQKSDPFVITYMGDARWEKGFELLPAIVDELRARLAGQIKLKFRVQVGSSSGNDTAAIGMARQRLQRLASLEPDALELIPGGISDRQYLDALRTTDLVLLPYEPTQYRIRGSGVATECATAGVPMVISPGLDIEETYANAAIEVARAYSVPALADAAEAAVRKTWDQTSYRNEPWFAATSRSPRELVAKMRAGGASGTASPARAVLWIANDTRGEGSERVYDSQLAYLESRGFTVFKVRVPYPSRSWFGYKPAFDWAKFIDNKEWTPGFTADERTETAIRDIEQNGISLRRFVAAWDCLEFPPELLAITRNVDFSFALVNYGHHMPIVRHLTGRSLKTIVETHDIQATQYALEQKRRPAPSEIEEELQYLNAADQLVSISKSEMKDLSRYRTPDSVTWCLPFIEPKARAQVDESPRRFDMVFVGSSNPSNIASLNWFLDAVFVPYLMAEGLTLLVIGNVGNHVDLRGCENLITLSGRVADLEPWLAESTMAVLPIASGTGVQIKVLDAFARGMPFAVTDFVAPAIGITDEVPLAKGALDLAEQIRRAVSDVGERLRLSEAGLSFTRQHASRETYAAIWDSVLRKIGLDL